MLEVSTLSSEFVHITGRTAPETTPLPADAVVHVAFTALDTKPENGDWVLGTFELTTATRFLIKAKVGAGGKVLTASRYDVWVRIATETETLVAVAGPMKVT